jgi:BASS family bile acid:Na+ symporter
MAILLGALPSAINHDILLFLAVAQFPIYMTPALLKPIVRRLVRNVDGRPV